MYKYIIFILFNLFGFKLIASAIKDCSAFFDGKQYYKIQPEIEADFLPVVKKSKSKLDLLKKLKANGKTEGFFDNFALVHKSSSSQKKFVNELNPRTIAFSGNIIMALASHNKSVNSDSDSIEVIQYDPKYRKYNFFEINYKNKKSVITKNPSSCLDCHPSTPIFDSYPSWPGFMESNDEYLKILSKNKETKPKVLEFFNFDNNTENTRDLGIVLGNQIYHKLYYDYKESKHFEKSKYLMLGLLMQCENLSDFANYDIFKESIEDAKPLNTFNYFRDKGQRKLKLAKDSSNSVNKDIDLQSEFFESSKYALIEKLFSSLDINLKDYSLSRKAKESLYSFLGGGVGGLSQLVCYYIDELKNESDIDFLYQYLPGSYADSINPSKFQLNLNIAKTKKLLNKDFTSEEIKLNNVHCKKLAAHSKKMQAKQAKIISIDKNGFEAHQR